jgi:nuclear transcription Y subunit beta
MSVDDDDDDDIMAMGDSTTATTTAAAVQNMSDENPNGYNNHNNNNNNDNDLYEEIREQDRYLPIANIARIMKNTLPENAKIAKESKETVQECVSEFISFITSEASDKCLQEKRKTINGDDLLWAMSTLGFDKYVEPLKEYLRKYRDTVSDSKKATKGGNTE